MFARTPIRVLELNSERRVWTYSYSLAGKHKKVEIVESLPMAEGYKAAMLLFHARKVSVFIIVVHITTTVFT